MTKRTITAVGVIVVFLVSGIATVAWAGIGTSPFQPEINQLGAAQNSLESIANRTTKTIDNPPIEGQASPALNGALNRLEAINKQLNSVRGFISSTVEAVLGIEPSPFREDVIPALEGVQGAAQGIADMIDEYLSLPIDPCIPVDFINALCGVLNSANMIVNETTEYIYELQGPGPGY